MLNGSDSFNNYFDQLVAECNSRKIDYSIIDNGAFSIMQKTQILEGLLKGLDVYKYAKPEYSSLIMLKLRAGLEENIDLASKYDVISWGYRRIGLILDSLKDGFDITDYVDLSFDYWQMLEIYKAKKDGFDITHMLNSKLSAEALLLVRLGSMFGLDLSFVDNIYLSEKEIKHALFEQASDKDKKWFV